jgi:asparagine synthase (glutamine-hydrolysing)
LAASLEQGRNADFMCGICGIIGGDRRQVEPATRAMMRAMIHRGPDDEGYEELPLGSDDAGPVAGFGFRRLAILDLSPAGHQPMLEPASGNWLIFNGEIYNYRHLRARLMVEGVRFRSTGDTEVLLQALTHWGERALQELEGMFAFAFYEVATRRVLLARDPVGIKPLYVSASDRQWVFASEVRAILASGLVSDDLSPAGIASFLMYGAPQDPLTVHRDIRSFPCGAYQWLQVEASSGRVRAEPPRRFWRFPAVNRGMSEATAIEQTRATLEASVNSHLAADVKTGFFLSAGMDSTAIAVLASRVLGRIATYTVGFESTSMASEAAAAAETARAIGAEHTEIVLRKEAIREWWDGWLNAADRPSIDGLNTYVISGSLKKAGATVAFSGLGADELFGGYANFRRVQRLAPLLRAAALIPAAGRQAMARLLAPCFPRRYRDRIASLSDNSGRPLDLAIELKRFLATDVLEALGLDAVGLGLTADYLSAEVHDYFDDVGGDPFLAVSRVETYLYMGNTLLRDSDTTSMAHGVELRVPFVGRPVLEEIGRIPGRLHVGRGTGVKPILRLGLAGMLPDQILRRPKTGFSLPVGDWMFGELRESCEAAIAALEHIPFLRQEAVQELWRSFVAERQHIYWMKPMLLVALGTYVGNARAAVD